MSCGVRSYSSYDSFSDATMKGYSPGRMGIVLGPKKATHDGVVVFMVDRNGQCPKRKYLLPQYCGIV